MKKTVLIFLMLITAFAAEAVAAPPRVFISGVNAVGVTNREEMQSTIKVLVASRLGKEAITAVDSVADADASVAVSYVVAGSVFSLDAVISVGGKSVANSFAEGEHPGGLIAAVGVLADKLAAQLKKVQSPLPSSTADRPAVLGISPSADIVQINERTMGSRASWRSQPLSGTFNRVAAGDKKADGTRDIFVADNRRLIHYRQGVDLRLIAEKELKVYEKIISLDVIDSGAEGLELYLTVVRNDMPVSQIWRMKGDSLQLAANGLPYFFRVMSLPGTPRKLYAQKAGGEQVFSGEVFEAERDGDGIRLKSPLKLPQPATIYTFSQFRDAAGRLLTVTYSADNKLVVFDGTLGELWRSSEVYGGSELFVERRGALGTDSQSSLQLYMNQRIQATPEGNVLVGKNESLWFLGKKGDYSNGSVYCLAWNGDHLEGKWHTRISENYMPDFYFDEKPRELLQLELVSRPHIFSRGTTVLTIRKID